MVPHSSTRYVMHLSFLCAASGETLFAANNDPFSCAVSLSHNATTAHVGGHRAGQLHALLHLKYVVPILTHTSLITSTALPSSSMPSSTMQRQSSGDDQPALPHPTDYPPLPSPFAAATTVASPPPPSPFAAAANGPPVPRAVSLLPGEEPVTLPASGPRPVRPADDATNYGILKQVLREVGVSGGTASTGTSPKAFAPLPGRNPAMRIVVEDEVFSAATVASDRRSGEVVRGGHAAAKAACALSSTSLEAPGTPDGEPSMLGEDEDNKH